MITSENEIRVLYAHTDKMGIVNNGRYFEFFEAGRNTLLRNIFPYTELEKNNIGLPVIEASAKYISAAVYDDVIIVKSYLREMPSVKVRIDYELYVKERLIVTGYTIHTFVSLSTMKPVRPPEYFLEKIKAQI